ncbi:uncharacterized protein MONOS_15679 [Monocercomonoides exilis]|uniref:uncharacterized protein n=1 Tax=Monocercomonoides exilis TaxID=2049356 RepID=UPI00355AB538|nr:hypothetical protein MONOS_15679 [Monocercomonoides exilis]
MKCPGDRNEYMKFSVLVKYDPRRVGFAGRRPCEKAGNEVLEGVRSASAFYEGHILEAGHPPSNSGAPRNYFRETLEGIKTRKEEKKNTDYLSLFLSLAPERILTLMSAGDIPLVDGKCRIDRIEEEKAIQLKMEKMQKEEAVKKRKESLEEEWENSEKEREKLEDEQKKELEQVKKKRKAFISNLTKMKIYISESNFESEANKRKVLMKGHFESPLVVWIMKALRIRKDLVLNR